MAKGTLALSQIQLGDNADTSKNFVISVPPVADGTLVIERENGTDVLSIAADGDVTLSGKLKQDTQSMVRLNTANGYGSSSTAVRRFTNLVVNQGSDITYADSATLGATFTINSSGVYSVSYTEAFTAAADFCVSRNATLLTGIPTTLSEVVTEASSVGGVGTRNNCAGIVYLTAGDVIRPQANGVASGTRQFFSITRVA